MTSADPELFWALLYEFTRLGLISFGGANIAEMERVLVGQRGWIDAQTLANGFALGQVMPGPNMLAVTHYGFAVGGWAGAGAATLGFYGPTALISAAVALLWRRHSAHPWVSAFRDALLPFGAGVLLAGALVLGQGSVKGWPDLLLAMVAFVLLWRTRLNAAVVVVSAAAAGALLGL
ncbi:chromate transporter [Deinococcus deserti]|uniref:Putative chromate transporter putative membrane protein n=1 Tax=Deinococcus deserti (strain DSM 17065 / CIP 109153 / LMG 22923 / VCD115) TaxID=546414 RepID=C1CUL9_DEIDV|nr:chromate transporter [Deinococcus deserti]ACO45886.1 putative chromate transporter; putative membrane protein [Deinococcus deserti VCD115]